jgi:DNA-binding NarL/FixJ family response regulator
MSEDPRSIGLGGLNAAEVAIVELMMEGLPTRVIAEMVGITEGHVMLERASIYKKLKVRNRTEAIDAWQRLQAETSNKPE